MEVWLLSRNLSNLCPLSKCWQPDLGCASVSYSWVFSSVLAVPNPASYWGVGWVEPKHPLIAWAGGGIYGEIVAGHPASPRADLSPACFGSQSAPALVKSVNTRGCICHHSLWASQEHLSTPSRTLLLENPAVAQSLHSPWHVYTLIISLFLWILSQGAQVLTWSLFSPSYLIMFIYFLLP